MAILDRVGGFIKRVGRGITGVIGVFSGLIGWGLGIPGFLIDVIWFPIFGSRLKKKMWVRYIILADETGRQLLEPGDLAATMERTADIMRERADIKIMGQNVMVAYSAPSGALDITTPTASFFEQATEVGAYFNALAGIGPLTRTITVFVVRSMRGHDARSFGPFTNFVMVTVGVFKGSNAPETTVAHELGHQCGLLHRGTLVNLMFENNADSGVFRGTSLSTWQASVVRMSRFVWKY